MPSPGECAPYDHRVNSERPTCRPQRKARGQELPGLRDIDVVQPRPTQAPALGLCPSQPADDALSDDVSFKLGHGGQT